MDNKIKLIPMTDKDFINEYGNVITIPCVVDSCPINARAGCSYVFFYSDRTSRPCLCCMCIYHSQYHKGHPYCPEHYNKVST